MSTLQLISEMLVDGPPAGGMNHSLFFPPQYNSRRVGAFTKSLRVRSIPKWLI
jgi:hypothetical protein